MVGGSWWFLDVWDPPYEKDCYLGVGPKPPRKNHSLKWEISGLYLEDGLPGLVRIARITPIYSRHGVRPFGRGLTT